MDLGAADTFDVAESRAVRGGTTMSNVKLLARWNGWCDPCETERPLALTETGEHGVRAWLRGVGAEDRTLTLTCGVCGEWQDVPFDEEDDEPLEIAASATTALQPLGARQVVLCAVPYPAEAVPAPRAEDDAKPTATIAVYRRNEDDVLELLTEGLDLIAVAGR
jgi:hypothetical protein